MWPFLVRIITMTRVFQTSRNFTVLVLFVLLSMPPVVITGQAQTISPLRNKLAQDLDQ